MGPLNGHTVIELAGLGPGPFCGMMLADMGARVIRVEPVHKLTAMPHFNDPLLRGRDSIALDLKAAGGVDVLLRMVKKADVLFEGYRPGVAERLGFGPEVCFEHNPRLVFGRITGWGQDGPLRDRAGHDINYISLSGVLHAVGRAGETPVPPLNFVGDFGGGGMLLAFGITSALLETAKSGKGQVVDAAMLDGAVAMMAMSMGFREIGLYRDKRGTNFLSGAAHYYDTYETKDGKYLAVGALEPEFYDIFIELAGLDRERFAPHGFGASVSPQDSGEWQSLKEELACVMKSKTRQEWQDIFADSDACTTPVLNLEEAAAHPHNRARKTFVENDGAMQNAPAPRFSRTAPVMPASAAKPGVHSNAVLESFGFSDTEIAYLNDQKVIVQT